MVSSIYNKNKDPIFDSCSHPKNYSEFTDIKSTLWRSPWELFYLFLSVRTIATTSTPSFSFGLRNGTRGVPCRESQKRVLLMFKQDLKDPSNRLSSWTSEGDCCNWSGVVCDGFTGHVRELHLNNPNPYVSVPFLFILNYKGLTWLGGKINPSLLYLKHLNYLDLSCKNFQGNQIPSFFGPLKYLRYLNLSQAGFQGMIPP